MAGSGLEVRGVPVSGRRRAQLAHSLDGRYGSMDPRQLEQRSAALVAATPVTRTDVVLGLPEGGTAPAYEFARQAGLPLVLASRFAHEGSGAIVFDEIHAGVLSFRLTILGLAPDTRVVLVEDEVTTGRTVVACALALRAAGVSIETVATLLAVDNPQARARIAEAGLRLVVGEWLPPTLLEELGDVGP